MKFAHMADIHLGSWREPKLRELSDKAFVQAVNICIREKVNFVLISGDLFNTSIPAIESMKIAVSQLKTLKDKGIPVYTIAGSHDFSPSGKTMLEVLEEAGLITNVCKGQVIDQKLKLHFTIDPRTGAKITGMIGKKGMLERKYYDNLITDHLETESGFKIFMFHTAISELKPADLEKMDSAPLSLLPKGFDYYAGGHVHIVKNDSIPEYKNVVYPGPTFPNSFSELEKLGSGGLYVYSEGKLQYEKIELCKTILLHTDCSHKTPQQVTESIIKEVEGRELDGHIVLLRLSGQLETGKTSDINIKKIIGLMEEQGAYLVIKNTSKLTSREFEEIKVKADTTEEAEQLVIEEHVGQVKTLEFSQSDEKELVKELMAALDKEKHDGESQSDYEERIVAEIKQVFENRQLL